MGGVRVDDYSKTVIAVAQSVTPHVASVRLDGGSGSAVVFENGRMLTNAHVVGRAHRGKATFSDGSEASFEVAGADPLSDLAVLTVNGQAPTPAILGNAD